MGQGHGKYGAGSGRKGKEGGGGRLDELEIDAPHWGVFDSELGFTHGERLGRLGHIHLQLPTPTYTCPAQPTHPCAVHYIHDDSFGNKSKPTIRDMRVDIEPYAVHASFRIHNKPSSAVWGWTATESVPIKAAAYLPSSSVVQNFLGGGVSSECNGEGFMSSGLRVARRCLWY